MTNNQAATNTNNQAVSVAGDISNTSLTEAQLASHTHAGQYEGTGPGGFLTTASFRYPYAWQGAAPFNKAIGSYVQDAGSGTGHNHAHTLSGTLTGTVTTSISGSVTASGTNTFSPYVVVNYIIRF